MVYTDLGMMAGVATVCEVCEGKRFQAAVLEYRFGGRTIAEVLGLLEDPAALPALAVAASDPAEDVRLAALMALGAMPGAAPVLRGAAEAEGRTGALARALASRLS